MFKKTRLKIRTTITNLKAAFALFVATVENLRAAVEANTAKIEALAAEQTELRTRLDKIAESNRYLVSAKRSELQRAGQRTDL